MLFRSREIRDYAVLMFGIAKKVAPLACASFERHVLGGVRLSKEEAEAFRRLLDGNTDPAALGLSGKDLERLALKLPPLG